MGKVLLTLFQSYNHTVVFVADAALFERLAQKFAAAADDELAELHLPLLYLQVFRGEFGGERLGKLVYLVVVTDNLKLVAREYHGVAIRDVQALRPPSDAAHIDAETLAEMQLLQ